MVAASWVAMGAAVRSSAVVQHSLNVFRPPSGTAFTLVRSLLVCLPFLMSAMAQVLAYTQLARVTQIAGARGYLKGASEALLKNASSSRKGSIAALAPDTDIGKRDYEHEVPGDQSLLHMTPHGRQTEAQWAALD
ncbi:TPA: hypothetical protein ACH3X1_007233 [Trebouxia sp. C0004]